MSILTLSPEAHRYAVCLVALAASSGATIAGLVHARRRASAAAFLPTYVLVLGLIVALGLVLLDLPSLVDVSRRSAGAALPAGVIAAVAAVQGESLLARLRGRHGARRRGRIADAAAMLRPDITSGGEARRVLALLVLVAAGEEACFRGILLDIAALADSAAGRAALVVVGSVLFALSHARLGLAEALGKLPLSAACLAAALASGGVAAPIVGHAIYNAHQWRAARRHEGAPVGAAEARQAALAAGGRRG